MMIPCPYCGPRLSGEFVYRGDAGLMERPDPQAPEAVWTDYVFMRDNPAGLHRELWYHAVGCGAWLIVERDTRSHDILRAVPAKDRT